jgi:hypothetical protein
MDRHSEQISLNSGSSRQCEFCRRELSDGFLFCPFCGRRIGSRDRSQAKWYHSRYGVAFALAALGPFALPVVWSNPRYSIVTKAVITIVTLAVTALLVYLLVIIGARLIRQIEVLVNVD